MPIFSYRTLIESLSLRTKNCWGFIIEFLFSVEQRRRCYIVRAAHADSPQIGTCLRMVLEKDQTVCFARGDHYNIRHHAMSGVASIYKRSLRL